jgi:RNase P subunit RPR2
VDSNVPIFCRRCSAPLTPGEGNFYVIAVEAFADPSPPRLTQESLATDQRQVLRELMAQMEHFSERELLETVHRKMNFFLCAACYRRWIEDPTG